MDGTNATRSVFFAQVALIAVVLLAGAGVEAGLVYRQRIEPGVVAAIQDGRRLYIECSPPRGEEARAFLSRYLLQPSEWTIYKNRRTVAIPYDRLNGKAQRRALEALFPKDYVNQDGWWHTLVFAGEQGTGAYWQLAEWFTGRGTNYKAIQAAPGNRGLGRSLKSGDKVLIPAHLLKPELRTTTSRTAPTEKPPLVVSPTADLRYGQDRQGRYAEYRLKPGEALYTAVVVRFTDFRDNADIHRACGIVQRRSNIADPHKMKAGQRVLIPLDMLSDQYQPEGSAERLAYEQVQEEAEKLQAEQVRTKGLEGIVVILDAGHGGKDYGAHDAASGLYEDELAYDIVCRIKKILETTTNAEVHVTVRDPNQGDAPTDNKRFVHDTDEYLLTSPHYPNLDAKTSANLRWYLANSIYERVLAKGTQDRQVLFASIHCDALFNGSLRGAMVYVPGAQYRRDREQPGGRQYDLYAEARARRAVTSTAAQRRRDEALSRNFATTLLRSLAQNNPPLKVHDTGDPIRNVIRRGGGETFVPAVLRNTMVPTKVLVETANLTNELDRERLADPQWRQWFAEAFVAAVRAHYGS